MAASGLHPPAGIGIIGCGRVAEDIHLPTLARTEAATAVAATDLDTRVLSRVAGAPSRR